MKIGRLSVSWWHTTMKLVMFVGLVAVAAAFLLQHAGQLEQGEQSRITAKTQSEEVVKNIRLAAGITQCPILGLVSSTKIDAAFGTNTVAVYGKNYVGDRDPSSTGTVSFVPKSGVSMTAINSGPCASHGRRLGGMSSWIALPIGYAVGLVATLGTIALLVRLRVPVAIASSVGNAAGGFIGSAVAQYLTTGKISWKTFASGLFGAILGAAAGPFERVVIRGAQALPDALGRAIRGAIASGEQQVFVEMTRIVGEAASNEAQREFITVAGQWLAQHP